MMRKLIFAWALVLASIGAAAAKTYVYEAKIEGMVCAFCAYNVSKRIEALPGVSPGSVVVNLDTGLVQFSAGTAVEEEQVSTVLNDTGFSITALRVTESGTKPTETPEPTQQLALRFDQTEAERFESVLDAIGTIAASTGGQLRIRAPSELEIALLKPLLAGRKQSTQVEFDATSGPSVEVYLLFAATGRQPR